MTKKTKAGKPKGKFIPLLTKKRRKGNHCLNCGTEFEESYNYCPHCGQENNHNQVSLGTLVVDFLNNYFSFDSKFSLSLLPFFFEPGYLTKKFIEGKRTSFVNPIRLYLIISLLFFFVFNMISRDVVQQSIKTVDNVTENLSDSSKQVLDQVLSGDLEGFESDSVIQLSGLNPDSTDSNYQISYQKPDSSNSFLTEANIQTYMRLRNDYTVDVDHLLDSLNTSSLSEFQYNLTKKVIRLDRAESQIVISQLLKNLPLMMLFTLPLFAFLLKLFYMRRNQYYITHLVHALHLHSFAYLVYGLAFVMAMYWLPEGRVSTWTIFIAVIIVSTHSFFSFLNVYGQKWFKTLVKFNLVGFLYVWLLLAAIIFEMLFSVATY